MPKPIFFVDGQTEQRVVQEFCPGAPVQRIMLNGKSVTIRAIAAQLAALIKLNGGRNYPIIVLIDREQRRETFIQIADELRECLASLGLQHDDLRIGVADRMFENWLLADWASLTDAEKPARNMDGRHGTGELKKVVGNYHKSTDGYKLFKKMDQEQIYNNSPSYRYFADQLKDLQCFLYNFLYAND